MSPRRPTPARGSHALPTLATLLAGAALSVGCEHAEAQSLPTTPPSAEPQTEILPAQQAVQGLPPTAMTIPLPPEPPREEFAYGGAMAMVRYAPRRAAISR